MLKSFFRRSKDLLSKWFRGKPHPPKSQVFNIETAPVPYEPDKMRPTKAYADGRQKMLHNRRRKPSKAMKNLYHL